VYVYDDVYISAHTRDVWAPDIYRLNIVGGTTESAVTIIVVQFDNSVGKTDEYARKKLHAFYAAGYYAINRLSFFFPVPSVVYTV